MCTAVFIEAAGQAGGRYLPVSIGTGRGERAGVALRQGRAVFALRALGFFNKILQ